MKRTWRSPPTMVTCLILNAQSTLFDTMVYLPSATSSLLPFRVSDACLMSIV